MESLDDIFRIEKGFYEGYDEADGHLFRDAASYVMSARHGVVYPPIRGNGRTVATVC